MKKLIALGLSVLMLISSLVSCGDGADKELVSSQNAASEASSVTETEQRFEYIDNYIDDLAAECEFGGATFSVLTDTDWRWPMTEEETGVLEDDAIYGRNREIEEKFNIDFSVQIADGTGFEYAPHEAADRLKNDIMAGFSTYDLVLSSIMICGVSSLNTGVIRPVDDVEGLDITGSWWMRDIYDQFAIGGSLYYLTGKVTTSHYHAPQGMLFNKKMMEDYGVTDDLYACVRDGSWTVDKMSEIASVVPQGGEHFRYLHGGNIGGLAFYFGGGYRICEIDEEFNPTVPTALSSDQIDFIDKLETVLGDPGTSRDRQKWGQQNEFPDRYEVFSEDIYMFSQEWMGAVEVLRDTDVEFGILPMPKRDALQEDYYAFASAWGIGGLFLPIKLKDEKMTGYITEAMGALSEKHLEPAYYEKSLKGRSTYDVESRDMLDIIYNSVVIDLSDIYQWGSVVYVVNDGCIGYTDTFSSSYSSSSRLANRQIKQLLGKLEKRK